ncbi:MAG: hypothetical protein HYZ20_19405 [Burkholderiales bacterium]|nr:hypothetical protein [Burkholderiales bacterium]
MTAPRHANPLLDAATRPLPRRIAAIGAGTIGPDIAYDLKTALPGLALTLPDCPPRVRHVLVDRVHALAGAVPRIAERAPAPPPLRPDAAPPRSADGRVLSAAVVGVITRAVHDAAAAPTLAEALEVGYRAFGEVACTAAAREGIEAFLAHRAPDFGATG